MIDWCIWSLREEMEEENEKIAKSGIDEQELEQKTKTSETSKIDSTTNGAPSEVGTKQNSSQDLMVEQEVEKKPKKKRNKSNKSVGYQKNTCQNGAVNSDAIEKVATVNDNNEEKVEKPQKKRTRRPKKHRSSGAAKIESNEIENSNLEIDGSKPNISSSVVGGSTKVQNTTLEKCPKKSYDKPAARRSNNSFKKENDNRQFPEYYMKEVVDHARKNGVLISGTLRIHAKSFEEAYVSSPNGGTDFSIQGKFYRVLQ